MPKIVIPALVTATLLTAAAHLACAQFVPDVSQGQYGELGAWAAADGVDVQFVQVKHVIGVVQQADAFDGPDIVTAEEDIQSEGVPIQPQVQQILATIPNNAAGMKKRDAAEQKLVNLGPAAVDFLKSQIPIAKGPAKDALTVAAFRLENAPLSPKEAISSWVSKKAGVDPAGVIIQRIPADDFRKLFPNHLFYTAENKPDAAGKNGFPRTVVALAADGKVQAITNDLALAKFLKFELPEKAGKTEQRHAAAAAAVLALARQTNPGFNVQCDAQPSDTGQTGTAQTAGAKPAKVSVALTFTPDGRTATVLTSIVTAAPPAAPETATKPPTPESPATAPNDTEAETMPATPAGRFRRLPPVRLRALDADQ